MVHRPCRCPQRLPRLPPPSGAVSARGRVTAASLPEASAWALSGTVRKDTFELVGGVTVDILGGANANRTTTTNTGGYYAFWSLDEDSGFNVRFSAPAYNVADRFVTLTEDTSLDVTLTPNCAIPSAPSLNASPSGTAVTFTWSPVTDAADYVVEGGLSRGSSSSLSQTTSGFSYSWTSVPPGTYFARVRARSSCGLSDSSEEVSFTVSPTVAWTFNGTLRDEAASFLSGVTVQILTPPNSDRSTTTDANERFSLPNLLQGGFSVRFSKSGYKTDDYSFPTFDRDTQTEIVMSRACTTLNAPSLSASVSSTTVAFTWSSVSGATDYIIEGGSTRGSTPALSQSTSNTSYTWTSVSPGIYFVRVRARASCGSGDNSNEVSFTVAAAPVPSCVATLSPTNRTVSEAPTSGSVTVTAASSCAWAAASNASFITITSSASGAGNGTVNYSVAANTTGSGRTGTATIAGQTFTVTQAFPSCGSATLSPTSQDFSGAAGTGTVTVTMTSGCEWRAIGGGFVTITSGASGVGSGTVNYSVAANTTGSSRTQTITIAGQPFAISQSTSGAPSCSATLSSASRTVTSAETTGSVTVTPVPASCTWTATSNASFITITSGASGTGAGTVEYRLAANSGGSRTGTMTIAGQTFTLTQTPSCGSSNVTLSPPTGADFTGAGGTGTVNVTIPAGCAWQAFAGDFLSITSGSSGVGPGTVPYSVLPNTTGNSRNRSIAIAGLPFMISQSTVGAPNCGATLSPTSRTATGAATTGSVTVTLPSSACGWTATSNASWITLTGGTSGTGSGTVSYSVAELTSSNPSYPSRTGTVTIAQQTFTITQTAPSCGSSSVTLSPATGASFTGAGGTGAVSVTIPAGCAWDVLLNISNTWITIQSPGVRVGPSTVTYTVAPNATGASRNHSLGFAGQPFMISQAAN